MIEQGHRIAFRVALVGAIALVSACGEAAPDAPFVNEPIPEHDPASAAISLCGADDSVGFIATSGGGGPILPGSEVLAEIGFARVAISTSCEFWTYTWTGPRGGPGGFLRTGQLTETQVDEIEQRLQLDSWATLEPRHGTCCYADSGVVSYYWGTDWVSWEMLGNSPPLPDNFQVDLPGVLGELLDFLAGEGALASGPVRYVVLSLEGTVDSAFARAPPWPLERSIAEVASDLTFGGIANPVFRAEGEDAVKLRAIRAAAATGAFGSIHGGTIPIQQPDGSSYHLFIRDIAAFESPEGTPTLDPLAL
ncbi:MAG: hypothetical protein WBG86_21390 [Polyangiales bacterium]